MGKGKNQPSEEARDTVLPEQRCASVSAGQEIRVIGQISNPIGVIIPWYRRNLCFIPVAQLLLVLISSQAEMEEDESLKPAPRKEALAQD